MPDLRNFGRFVRAVLPAAMLLAALLAVAGIAPSASAQDAPAPAVDDAATADDAPSAGAPLPPTNLRAKDVTYFKADRIRLRWDNPPRGDGPPRVGYEIYRSPADADTFVLIGEAPPTAEEFIDARESERVKAALEATEEDEGDEDEGEDAAGEAVGDAAEPTQPADGAADTVPDDAPTPPTEPADAPAEAAEAIEEDVEDAPPPLERGVAYIYRVVPIGEDEVRGQAVTLDTPATATVSPLVEFQRATAIFFDWGRFWLTIVTIIFCGSVILYIFLARRGVALKVRKIAGLSAVDEAVGRATEMGRSVLYVPGIQDINDIQTIAGITVLSRVAKTAAEYDAKVEVPTARSLVMTTARETVQAAYLSAGRPDAYNQDLIYYVTDEQFGYVAYLSGMMVREKPAACFYMGAFFAESLILAETGNSIGAIQVAGTAMPAQLPFFVAACDYTLIGEEFFAASAYLSGSAEELGSLKGQDVGKIVVGVLLVIGVALFTAATIMIDADIAGAEAIMDTVAYIKERVLT